jgi:hypothetical protein
MADFRIAWLPPDTPSLAFGPPPGPPSPPPPPGTIYVLAAHGGYVVPPRKFTLLFGRDTEAVHVPVGPNDGRVSRLQGRFMCDGTEWWLCNTGKLPIQMPYGRPLLGDQEMPLTDGFLSLAIGQPRERQHVIEVRVVGRAAPIDPTVSTSSTLLDVYDLSPVERKVLASLAQWYLRDDKQPQPATWRLVSQDMNRLGVPRTAGQEWNERAVQEVVRKVRERLASDPVKPIGGVLSPEPGSNAANENLIAALLATATLMKSDLGLIDR